MFKVIACDLDGTLLNTEHSLSPYTKKVLQALKEKGLHFAFATGRHHVDVARMRKNMEIEAYMITSNGARVFDPNDNIIYSKSLDPELARAVAREPMKDSFAFTHVYRGDVWLTNRVDSKMPNYFVDTNFTYELFDPMAFDGSDVAKFYFTVSDVALHSRLVEFKDYLEAKYGSALNVVFSTLVCLEVMASPVSKGNALDVVSKQLGLTLNDCIAFGDGMNDVEMLSMAGKGCIMKNGAEELKSLLPDLEIIGSNANDAVPHYLNELFLHSSVN